MTLHPPTRTLRADAQRNRDKLLSAATQAFAAEGEDVPLEAIAARAGVGIGTLYRHFPSREALVCAAFRGEVDALCAAGADLLESLPAD
ncbi:MAG TPA: helix-turn-helix domain-containing protein, partial [Chloroflexota bacterium]